MSELSTRVSEDDHVRVAGLPVRRPPPTSVVAYYKPRGVVTTHKDEKNRPSLATQLPRAFRQFAYVGRLDQDSEGLLLLTNNGGLADFLARPHNKIEKEYLVTLEAPLDPAKLPKLLRGFPIPAGHARMERVSLVGERTLSVVLTQGLKRQIREMLYRVGAEVVRLVRVRIGPITLDRLAPGQWRQLSAREISSLRKPSQAAGEPAATSNTELGERKKAPRPSTSD